MANQAVHVVLIETGTNQGFIFGSNKLRENIGASELVYRAGADWTLEAVHRAGGPDLCGETPAVTRANLLDPSRNAPITGAAIEVLVATSSKALLLVADEQRATAVVRDVTRRALRDAPGLDVCGVVSRRVELGRDALHEAVTEVHEAHPTVRASRPGPTERFLRLPPVAACATSALPATGFDLTAHPDERDRPRSRSSLCKRAAATGAEKRFAAIAARTSTGARRRLARSVDELERVIDALDWVAVVHADGNGIGAIASRIHEHLALREPRQATAYANALRRFSCELDDCGERALISAIDVLGSVGTGQRRLVPVVPLVVGGDDLTALVDGRSALPFVVAYLRAFERETANETGAAATLVELARRALGHGRLGACAGVAIIKPHFPFSVAYDLAAELTDSAKQVKRRVVDERGVPVPCAAIDFHAHYDSTGGELDTIRKRLDVDEGETQLTAKPYVVSGASRLGTSARSSWMRIRSFDDLIQRADQLGAVKDGRAVFPSSQRHLLRETAFQGARATDGQLAMLDRRYDVSGIAEAPPPPVDPGQESRQPLTLFADDDLRPAGTSRRVTRYLDTLEILEFWPRSAARPAGDSLGSKLAPARPSSKADVSETP